MKADHYERITHSPLQNHTQRIIIPVTICKGNVVKGFCTIFLSMIQDEKRKKTNTTRINQYSKYKNENIID